MLCKDWLKVMLNEYFLLKMGKIELRKEVVNG